MATVQIEGMLLNKRPESSLMIKIEETDEDAPVSCCLFS